MADLEKLKQTTHHNVELDLKQDHDKWQLKAIEPLTTTTVARDELTEELKKLEQDEEEAKFIEGKEQEHEESAVGQPTVQEMQQEQQRIDDEIQSEINKDEMETMEVSEIDVTRRLHLYNNFSPGWLKLYNYQKKSLVKNPYEPYLIVDSKVKNNCLLTMCFLCQNGAGIAQEIK